MADTDDALARTAVGLDADAKASRPKKKTAAQEADALFGKPAGEAGETGGETLSDAVASLGKSVDAQAGAGTDGYDVSEGAHTLAIERMENLATDAVLSDKSLVWDVRDFLLDQIKSRPKPWSGTSQGEQRDVAAACEHSARELVRKVVEAIAANGKDPVRVLLTKVTMGDDIVIAGKVKTFADEEEDRAVVLLHSARGKHVLLTAASADDYNEGQRDAETDADQPGLEFEAGNDDPPDDDADLAGE